MNEEGVYCSEIHFSTQRNAFQFHVRPSSSENVITCAMRLDGDICMATSYGTPLLTRYKASRKPGVLISFLRVPPSLHLHRELRRLRRGTSQWPQTPRCQSFQR